MFEPCWGLQSHPVSKPFCVAFLLVTLPAHSLFLFPSVSKHNPSIFSLGKVKASHLSCYHPLTCAESQSVGQTQTWCSCYNAGNAACNRAMPLQTAPHVLVQLRWTCGYLDILASCAWLANLLTQSYWSLRQSFGLVWVFLVTDYLHVLSLAEDQYSIVFFSKLHFTDFGDELSKSLCI